MKATFWFLTHCAECHKAVLPGVDGLVVRSVSPHVCGTVDQPGSVEHDGVAHEAGYEVAYCQGLTPQVPGYQHGRQEAEQQHGELVVPERARPHRSLGSHQKHVAGRRASYMALIE